jgi:HD-like signal output (HDOD) protein
MHALPPVVDNASNASPRAARVAGDAGGGRKLLLCLEHTDPTLLTALSAALGGSSTWQITSVADAGTAQRLLRERAFDAVVAELRASGADALALMRSSREQCPATLRVLLCGNDQDALARALPFANRVLPTPCHAGHLAEEILRAVGLHALLDSPRLLALIGSVGQLPSPPRVYLQLTTALQDPATGANDLADIVATDPALAAAVLRLCNSAFFSAGTALGDLRAAVQRLGTRTLRHLVLACEAFAPLGAAPAVDPALLQRRALLASVLAPLVLDHWAQAELARSAALLADIGLLLPPLPATDGARPLHADAAAALLSGWGLPEAIVEAVAFHHTPAAVGATRLGLTGAVHVAVALANGEPPDEDYLRRLGLHDKLREWRKLVGELSAMV